jgi:membrane protease YdiL (CAAX protease family)
MTSAPLVAPRASTTGPWLKALLALAVFFLVSWPVSAGCRALFPGVAWLPQSTVKVVMLVGSIAAAALAGKTLSEIGFRRPLVGLTWKAIGIGLLLGALTTLFIFAAGAQGLRPLLKNLSFAQVVLTIWILSSVAEEVFCRGWFQTWALGSRHENARAVDLLPSAVLFGAMHLGLLLAGVEVLSVAILVPMVTLLGGLAAWARARSGSLYPAIAGHVAFNVGGVVGGIVFRIVTGHLPG